MKKVITAMILIVATMAMTVTAFAGSAIVVGKIPGSAMMAGASAGSAVSEKKALSIALKDAGLRKSQVYAIESEYDDGKYEVEFKTKKAKTEYSYEISKQEKILEKPVDYRYKRNHSRAKIGKAAARKAVAKFSGISLKTIKKGTCVYEYDYDDREGKYEVKFRKGSYKYDYDVLAPNGKIIEYSEKYRR